MTAWVLPRLAVEELAGSWAPALIGLAQAGVAYVLLVFAAEAVTAGLRRLART